MLGLERVDENVREDEQDTQRPPGAKAKSPGDVNLDFNLACLDRIGGR
jgi:hypothetical protein